MTPSHTFIFAAGILCICASMAEAIAVSGEYSPLGLAYFFVGVANIFFSQV